VDDLFLPATLIHIDGRPQEIAFGAYPAVSRDRQLAADCFPEVDVVFATMEGVALAGQARSPFLQSILGSAIRLHDRERKRPLTTDT
jgi:hypothetical protein